MYAVIATGGKQYRVQQGETVRVEKLEQEPGATIEFNDVLLVADGENVKVGAPHVKGAKVTAEVVGDGRGPKLLIYKYRRRKGYRRKTGHRQPFTALKITGISA
ncbi:MAG TPA: 50S ribosomal protein L21 [Vicinamibacterales bacterium]|nr:50S ribosomal protein L21 [Vicinamibacterales bacterium]